MVAYLREDRSRRGLPGPQEGNLIVAVDSREETEQLEQAVLNARATSDALFEAGVRQASPCLRRTHSDSANVRKRVKLVHFSVGRVVKPGERTVSTYCSSFFTILAPEKGT